MVKVISIVSLLLATLATVLGAPVDTTTTVSPLQAIHNENVMSSVCVNMSPVHGDSVPQGGVAPYAMEVLQKTAAPGDTVQVKIHGLGSEEFRGVYIQGRHGDIPVGQFLKPGSNSPPVTISDCPPGFKNAASYISRQPIRELTLDYVVPDVPDVVFTATFVKTTSEFWVGAKSNALLVSRPQA